MSECVVHYITQNRVTKAAAIAAEAAAAASVPQTETVFIKICLGAFTPSCLYVQFQPDKNNNNE